MGRIIIVTFVLAAIAISIPCRMEGVSLMNRCRVVRIDGDYFLLAFIGNYPELKVRAELTGSPSWRIWKAGETPQLLWSIETDGRDLIHVVRYGEVPPNYTQTYPNEGNPTLLSSGEYEVSCPGPGRFRITEEGVTNFDIK